MRAVSREREEAGSFKTLTLIRRGSTDSRERERAGSLKTRRSRDESERRTDAEAERIWQEATTEEDDNRSIITRAASLESLETGSIINKSVETGSIVHENREGGS